MYNAYTCMQKGHAYRNSYRPSLRHTVITDGLVAAEVSSSLQSLSTVEKVKDWAGRCC